MRIKLVLAGNPNSGKTTIFNALTGSTQYVGNWPGVTVERKSGFLTTNKDVEIIDLPGIYSLSPYTPEEIITREYLLQEKPDAIINIIDSSNLERNLYLTTQILELNIPVVIALNMSDVVSRRGDKIDVNKLSEILNCPIVETSALDSSTYKKLTDIACSYISSKPNNKHIEIFSHEVTAALHTIVSNFSEITDDNLHFRAVKLFEKDEKFIKSSPLSSEAEAAIKKCEDFFKDDSESIITSQRYNYIEQLIKKSVTVVNKNKESVSDKIDNIVTNKFLAIPIFMAVMFFIYYISVTTIGAFATDWVNDILFPEIIIPFVEQGLTSLGTAIWLNSLIIEGIIGGVGAVLGFVPQILVLFFFLSILEDCGYMSRIAFIMDKLFNHFGLSGKSFIPMLIGTGCSVPGIMASRTVENQSERRMTIITTSFIPCSAKLPVIALIAGAIFSDSWWVAPSAYFIGILAVAVSGLMLKKLSGFKSQPSLFVMELPDYHIPAVRSVLTHTWERGWSFIKKAGTIIFVSCGVIWFLSTFNLSFEMVESQNSMLASFGKAISGIFAPLGFNSWQSTVAVITGLIAKENVVGTLGVLVGFNEGAVGNALFEIFTPISAYSFLVFNLLCAPCFAAIGAIAKEMADLKWTLFAVGYQTIFAYAIAFIVFQLGSAIIGGTFGFLTIVAIILTIGISYLTIRKES